MINEKYGLWDEEIECMFKFYTENRNRYWFSTDGFCTNCKRDRPIDQAPLIELHEPGLGF